MTYQDERYCPKCEKVYLATIVTEREGGELAAVHVSPCPDCGTDGQLRAERRPSRAARIAS